MSGELPLIRVTPQRGEGDCTIASLAMYLGVSYEDALEAATGATRKAHRRGMWVANIVQAAERLGVALSRRRLPRYWLVDEESHGILSGSVIEKRRRVQHVVVLRWGLIFEPDGGEVWEVEDYVAHRKAQFTELVTREA